jgi:chromosome segregation ATPase
MFNAFNLEEKAKQHELKLEALTLEFERLNQAVETFLDECQLTEEAVLRFNSTKEHFSEEAWEKLEQERKRLDEKLQKQLELIRNPHLAKKKYAERNVAPHWLFVR